MAKVGSASANIAPMRSNRSIATPLCRSLSPNKGDPVKVNKSNFAAVQRAAIAAPGDTKHTPVQPFRF
jgi:hypothetical protein